jgi:DNA recombination protein RmuC
METLIVILLAVLFLFLFVLTGAVIALAVRLPRQGSNEQIANLSGKIDAIQHQVSSNLQAVTEQVKVFGEVQQTLGKVTEATSRMVQLGEDVGKLQAILEAPSRRGGFGEVLLKNLLAQVMPEKYYRIQYAFKDNDRVDAALLLGEKVLPIDAKFPLDEVSETAPSDGAVKSRGTFIRAVKARIDETAKYIRPDENTFEFAFIYVPSEAVYYEVVSNAELFQYAMERHVVPVSPNSFIAYLQVVVYGLRGLQIEENARLILNRLSTLKIGLGEVEKSFATLGSHLSNAKAKYDEVDGKLGRFSGKLEEVVLEGLPEGATPASLPDGDR